MRKLRIAFITIAGGVPAIAATIFACGSDDDDRPSTFGPEPDAEFVPRPFDGSQQPIPPPVYPACQPLRIVDLPDAGDAATPEQVCAFQQPTVATVAARVTFSNFAAGPNTVTGFIAVPPELEAVIVGTPALSNQVELKSITKVTGGFEFSGTLSASTACGFPAEIAVTFDIRCDDGGTKTVESRTSIEYCDTGDGGYAWVSSGDKCCDCVIIAEMAPSPIVSDKQKDDLPLARVVRLRVLELARAGRQVLLFAENDAGHDLEIDWNVSGGSIERIAPDVILWTLPDDGHSPFGQVAVWTDAGAAVENFMWGAA